MGSVPLNQCDAGLSDAKQCRWCGSLNLQKFRGEIALRSPGLKGIDMPAVLVFPYLAICMACGIAQFVVPQAELSLLAKRDAASE